jgi:hypothetical protein
MTQSVLISIVLNILPPQIQAKRLPWRFGRRQTGVPALDHPADAILSRHLCRSAQF